MINSTRPPVFSLLAVLVLAACGDTPAEPVMVPVASVVVSPDTATLEVGQTRPLAATTYDSSGTVLSGRTVAWTSSDTTIATVSTSGILTALRPGVVEVTARSETREARARITIVTAPLRFADISAGASHTCGVTTEGIAYCWGWNLWGQLGTGTTGDTSRTPARVRGDLRFQSISAGRDHTCGLSTAGEAYCWGINLAGQLGSGTTNSSSPVPVPVAGGLRFKTVSAAGGHTCALATNGNAYCWGGGAYRRVPIAVSGGLTFQDITTATTSFLPPDAHSPTQSYPVDTTCGITVNGTAYCWGLNVFGQLGNSRTTPGERYQPNPVPVSGGLSFRSISAGGDYTCGLTNSGSVFCWGRNFFGKLGNGTQIDSSEPVAVSGGLTFQSVSAAASRTCGITTSGATYCWGSNYAGALGSNSTVAFSTTPVPVAGGFQFRAIATGGGTCALTAEGAAYCWGYNEFGQLGNGTTMDSPVPVPVARPR